MMKRLILVRVCSFFSQLTHDVVFSAWSIKNTRPFGANCIDQPAGRPASEGGAAPCPGWIAGLSKELWRDCDELGAADAFEPRWFDEVEELSE
jgi:hypothetical protein